jgi:undecaprenyl-phosphate 4-deoxy-4-formamido-L-arabinose transferase
MKEDNAAGTAVPPTISIVIPLYQDEEGLPRMFERLGQAMATLPPSELVLVNDGSRDRSGPTAVQLAQTFAYPTTVVSLSRNFGQHPAVFAGFEHARGEIVVTLDSDLQYRPEEIGLLVTELSEEFPVVSGYRAERSDPLIRRALTRTLSRWLSRRTGSELKDYGSMFRAYRRSVVDQLLAFRERRRYVPALVGWLGVPVKEIPVSHDPRGEQGSRYRIGPLVDMLLDLITGYATFPLRVITFVGLIGSLVSLAATIALLVYRIVSGVGPSGLVSAFAVLFFIAAVQLFVLGFIGEYVGRVYIEAKARPYYLVANVVTNDEQTSRSRR